MTEPLLISSRDNPRLVLVRRLCKDPTAYRRTGQVWLEGDHLLRACVARDWPLPTVLMTASAWQDGGLRELALNAQQLLLLPDALFHELSTLPSPSAIGALIDRPEALETPAALHDVDTVILDRVQDAGNVGSILRSAAALGVNQVLALQGCAALWSPKVLRAAMGAHFALRLGESLQLSQLAHLQLPFLATSSHAAAHDDTLLHESILPSPCAWVFGHEGQGLDAEVMQRCRMTLRIAQPGGEESLNVAAAAAICLHESLRQRAGPPSTARLKSRQ